VGRCLEKDPDRRFQTAKELRNELQALRQRLITGSAPTAAKLAPTHRRGLPASRVRARAGWLLGTAALAAAVALFAARHWKRGRGSARLRGQPEVDLKTYEAYLRGMHERGQRMPEGYREWYAAQGRLDEAIREAGRAVECSACSN
jgi:hypothetical protein